MLSTLLLILKIICIAVLVILGLILTMLIVVLFVPVRYRFWCSYKEGVGGEVKITWLFHLLSVLATYDQSLKISVKILGIPLGGSKKGRGEDGTEEDWEEDADAGTWSEDGRNDGKDNGPDGGQDTKRGEGFAGDSCASGNGEWELGKSTASGSQIDAYKKSSEGAGSSAQIEDSQTEHTQTEHPKKTGFSPQRILRKIKFRFQALCGKVKEMEEKGKRLQAFLADKANQKSFRQMLRMIKHILPRRITGSVEFGFDDPSVTGQVAALCSFAYARYGDALQITPVFDEQVLEVLTKGKGRMFLGVVLFWCLRILMNKNIRRLIFKRHRRKDGGE